MSRRYSYFYLRKMTMDAGLVGSPSHIFKQHTSRTLALGSTTRSPGFFFLSFSVIAPFWNQSPQMSSNASGSRHQGEGKSQQWGFCGSVMYLIQVSLLDPSAVLKKIWTITLLCLKGRMGGKLWCPFPLGSTYFGLAKLKTETAGVFSKSYAASSR